MDEVNGAELKLAYVGTFAPQPEVGCKCYSKSLYSYVARALRLLETWVIRSLQ